MGHPSSCCSSCGTACGRLASGLTTDAHSSGSGGARAAPAALAAKAAEEEPTCGRPCTAARLMAACSTCTLLPLTRLPLTRRSGHFHCKRHRHHPQRRWPSCCHPMPRCWRAGGGNVLLQARIGQRLAHILRRRGSHGGQTEGRQRATTPPREQGRCRYFMHGKMPRPWRQRSGSPMAASWSRANSSGIGLQTVTHDAPGVNHFPERGKYGGGRWTSLDIRRIASLHRELQLRVVALSFSLPSMGEAVLGLQSKFEQRDNGASVDHSEWSFEMHHALAEQRWPFCDKTPSAFAASLVPVLRSHQLCRRTGWCSGTAWSGPGIA